MDEKADSEARSLVWGPTAGVLSEESSTYDSRTTSYIQLPPSEVGRKRDAALLFRGSCLFVSITRGKKRQEGRPGYGL